MMTGKQTPGAGFLAAGATVIIVDVVIVLFTTFTTTHTQKRLHVFKLSRCLIRFAQFY